MTSPDLFSPIQYGSIAAKNRIVLAPLTRNRAAAGFEPSALAAPYYTQRADGGLLIKEDTHNRKDNHGYPETPGL